MKRNRISPTALAENATTSPVDQLEMETETVQWNNQCTSTGFQSFGLSADQPDPARDVERILKYLKHGNSPLIGNSSQSPQNRSFLASPILTSNAAATPVKPLPVKNQIGENSMHSRLHQRFYSAKNPRSQHILASVVNGAHRHIGAGTQDSKSRSLKKHNSFPSKGLSAFRSNDSHGMDTDDMDIFENDDDDVAAFCLDPKLDMILSQYETGHSSRHQSPDPSPSSTSSTTTCSRVDRLPQLQQESVASSTKDIVEDFDFDESYWQDPKLNLMLSQVEDETRLKQRSL